MADASMTPPFCTAEGDGSMDSSFLMEPGCQGGYALEHFLDRCPTETFLPELFQGRPSGPGGFGGRDVWNNPPLGSPRIPESRTITSTPSSRIPSLRNRASSLLVSSVMMISTVLLGCSVVILSTTLPDG